MSTGHLSFVLSTRRQLPRSMPGQVRPGTDGRGPPSHSQSVHAAPTAVDILASFPPVRGLVFGSTACGGSREVGVLLAQAASSSAQRQWRTSLGARSMLDARSFMISTLRSQVDFAADVAHARLRVSRIKLIGCLAAPPAATRLPRAPSLHRPPSSRRGEALWERVEAGSGSPGTASSESAAGSGRLRACGC